jgi:deazaflavin-dependent oxidoreductase (nitroreductase family)
MLTPIAIKLGSFSWMPKLLPQITWADQKLQKLTRGRVGFVDIAGLPSLTLTVPGRKSGIPRSTPLLCVPYADSWLIAGSSFGAPKPPLWAGNLRATDRAQVRYARRDHTVTWRELTGDEREHAWSVITTTWPNYDKYAEWTDRVIPVFELTPVRD